MEKREKKVLVGCKHRHKEKGLGGDLLALQEEDRAVITVELHPICLLAVWLVSVSYRHLPVGIFGSVFLYCKIWQKLHFEKFCGTPFCKFNGNLFFPQKGGLVHQKGGRSLPLREKRVPAKCTIPKRPDQVFLWYQLVKYQENTNRYRTEIPNRDATLNYSALPLLVRARGNCLTKKIKEVRGKINLEEPIRLPSPHRINLPGAWRNRRLPSPTRINSFLRP
jgi:hypothetical protein